MNPDKKKKKATTRNSASSYIEFKNIDKSAKTAWYFGFTPVSNKIMVTKKDREKARELLNAQEQTTKPSDPSFHFRADEKTALVRYCEENEMNNGPMPFALAVEFTHEKSSEQTSSDRALFLELLGCPKPIAEAIVIETALSILKDEKKDRELSVHINSVGDRDAQNRFTKELGNFFRKNIATLPAVCRNLLKRNPISALLCVKEKCQNITSSAPKSVAFLNETSRIHLKDTLEHLESLDIAYTIDHFLFGNRSFTTETIFEIREERKDKDSVLLATGCRYNTLTKKLGWRRECQGVGIKIFLNNEKTRKRSAVRIARPKIFFLQLGNEAKLKGLKVINSLREKGISLDHALAREKLLSQLGSGENTKMPFSLIMGQREAIENSAIVRVNTTRAQETIPIPELAQYIKKLLR